MQGRTGWVARRLALIAVLLGTAMGALSSAAAGAVDQAVLYGDGVAGGSSPAAVNLFGGTQPNVFTVDAGRGDTIDDWMWGSGTGWVEVPFYRDSVTSGSSPAPMQGGVAPEVFMADASAHDTLSAWAWNSSTGWQLQNLGGDPIAHGSTPAAIDLFSNSQPNVFAVDAARGDTIDDWVYYGSAWHQLFFYGDTVAPGTSPAALSVGSQPNVFVVDASRGDTIEDWVWNSSTGWQQQPFDGDPAAPGTSPVALDLNGQPNVFYVDALKGDTIADWQYYSSAWHELFFYGDPVARGTSPSASMIGANPYVFYDDASSPGAIDQWHWSSGAGWTQQVLAAPGLDAAASPAALDFAGAGRAHVFYVDGAAGGRVGDLSAVAGPGLSLTGTLASANGQQVGAGSYSLQAAATGTASGVLGIQAFLDGQRVLSSSGCSGSGCSAAASWSLVPSAYGPGFHTLVVQSWDGNGDPSSQVVAFAVPSSAPGTTAPSSLPVVLVPVSGHGRLGRLRVRITVRWTWLAARTWLDRLAVVHLPRRALVTISCRGRGCPWRRRRARAGAALRRLERALKGGRFRAGDRLDITIAVPGYRPERAAIWIRSGRKPRARLLAP
jgi:hypothetical protein